MLIGGRLARWLQPDPYADPSKCEVIYCREDMRCGWPTIVTVLTKDQYSDIVHVPNLKIEVKAVPIEKSEGKCEGDRKVRKVNESDSTSIQPPLDVPYEVTVDDKICYHSITMMKAYENFSFEELRYYSPSVRRTSENMLVRPYNDGTYCATWTPSHIGWYSILVTIDGYPLEEVYKAEVKEPPQGVAPPTQSVAKKTTHQPSKVRKFVSKYTAGLRIRAHPSLQSEQIGIVHVNGTIAFIDEIHNDDGVWLRLNHETMKQYCAGSINRLGEAWCLQYNQHLGKTLLLPVEEPKRIMDQVIKESLGKKLPEINQKDKSAKSTIPGIYTVVKCGAACHNVRSRPSLQSTPVGMMVLGNQAEVLDQVVNSEGTWVKINPEVASKFCFNHVTEAWSLARSPNNELFLRPEPNPDAGSTTSSPKKGYDFMANSSTTFATGEAGNFSFTPPRSTPPQSLHSSADPFVFGFGSQDNKIGSEKRSIDKVKSPRDGCNDVGGVSVKDMVKAIGECRINGNGETPPGATPKRCSSPKPISVQQRSSNSSRAHVVSPRSSSPNIHTQVVGSYGDMEKTSQSSSPVPIPVSGAALVDSQYSITSQRRGSTQSDTSALVSSLTRDLSQSPLTKDLSPSPTSSSFLIRSEGSPVKRDCCTDDIIGRKDARVECSERSNRDFSTNMAETPKKVTQAGTQTSPEGTGSMKGYFNIGSAGGKDERVSPKFIRKERNFGRSSKRAMSPATQVPPSGDRCLNMIREPVKEAMSPSEAETLRCIFAAFLWQEGIVHDAMACASFLKFHPTLPKEGAPVVTRKMISPLNATKQELSKEQKQFQRHSVEVSTSGAYLQIQLATLESLTRSAANANANRTRKKQQAAQEVSIKEEVPMEFTRLTGVDGDNLNKVKSDELKNDNKMVMVAVLPPALKGMVLIWEELTSVFVRAFEQQNLLSSPTLSSKFARNTVLNREKIASRKHGDQCKSNKSEGKRSNRKKKDWKTLGKLNVLGETCELVAPLLVASNDRETVCELCGGIYPHPVTYHMRQAHPGCGGLAGGNGYNSSGNFCVGWAGHCGDGGIRGNSWYLICDACREKYIRLKKEGALTSKDKKKGSGKKKAAVIAPASSNGPLSPVFGQNNSLDGHMIMKENAMFLLDLASSSNSVASNQQSRSGVDASTSLLSSMAENQSPPDPTGPFSPVVSFQCLAAFGSLVKEQELQEMLQRQLPRDIDESCNGNNQPNSSFDGVDGDDQKGRLFHRSVSMGTGCIPWTKKEGDGRVILSRKRNNSSSGEVMADGGSSLLCRPSAALQKLIPGLDESAIISSEDRLTLDLVRRPSISFILRRHPIFALRLAMKHSLRKATCRLYAFQALNWLLRNVTQPVCLHDLLWWFVASLSTTTPDAESVEDQMKKEDGEMFRTCDHPLNDITFAGDAAIPLWKAFHQFLQTVADLMFLLPPSCALQTMAVRCWGLKFSQVDHGFLHRSQFFNNISKILSRSEEESDDVSVSLHESASSQHVSAVVEALKDLTADLEIKVSSRQAMVGSLTDNSTETFWESGDEDRNKTKFITVLCPPNCIPKMIYIHIDNCRDLANKVANVVFLSGSNTEELLKIRQVEVESRSTGWISSPIQDGRHNVIKLELRGPDNSLRIRQVRVLGVSGESLAVPQRSASTVQQRLCESETLKVFRLITSQVFGKLIVGEAEESAELEAERTEDNNDLKEHMVGILFSRSKLTHLQKQVCMHIVHAIRKETTRVREEWECLLCSPVPSESKPSDTYAFEMLSMVLALSGSSVGRVYLSHQYDLLMDLLSLLHTGSARVQRQVTALLRRVLPEVSPATLANVLGVEKLPPSDFSIFSTGSKQKPFDVYKTGILDVFLSVVAKSLTVQVKVKGRDVKGVTTVTLATAIHPRDPMGLRWWLRGCISRKLAEDIIQLLNDMSNGKLSEAWANVTKGAIAENIINLTKLDESQRGPSECLKTPTLWLALASLCVLDKEHVERLSSGQWSRTDGLPPPPRPTCTNHDDNVTGAIIQCSVCGNLCADCDRYLHLHKRTRMHQRQVCKEEEEAIKVDLHEGCGRTKLFWVLALADSCTLKAMVEFREGSKTKATGTGVCRFCGATGNSGLLAIGNVCADQDCQEHAKNICNKIHPCGHICGGLAGETVCLPCLQNCKSSPNLKQDADDMCMICFTEALSCAPAIQLQCGHVFHAHCTRNALVQRWAGPRITFSFSQCPICKAPMRHAVLSELLKGIQELFEDVKRKALMRLEYEGLHRAVAITSPGAKFFNDPAAYAMDRYAYYVCYKCNKAYYGGEARCDIDMNGEFDPSELVCGGCSDVARAQMCPKHGTDFLEYKCRYCCSVAVFFCFGTTHFCNSCHDDFQRVTNIAKSELPSCPAGPKAKQLDGDECPLHVSHPPTGEEFALGCGVCRNAHTF
ncbi:hypothetical protein RUM44_009825 [Polyplax serrata]|uniref:E3 ubiquitin-protein ligase MYCBP2 n=1 Tax=Polyplax serrata TaxID=468196 RepID=A0ABR1AU33_POLSC